MRNSGHLHPVNIPRYRCTLIVNYYVFCILVHILFVILGFSLFQTGKELKFSKSSIWKTKKKSEITKTSEQSRLEPETIRSRIFGLSIWAICELTNAGGKKIYETILVTITHYLYQHCACKRLLRTETKLSFRDNSVVGELIFLQ